MSIVSSSPTERQESTNTNNKEPIVSSSPTERQESTNTNNKEPIVSSSPTERQESTNTNKMQKRELSCHPPSCYRLKVVILHCSWVAQLLQKKSRREDQTIHTTLKSWFYQFNRCLLCTPNEAVIGRWLRKCYFSEINLAMIVRLIVSIPIWRNKLIFAIRILSWMKLRQSTTAGSSTTGCW